MRKAFIDFLNMETLIQKIKSASVNELHCLEDILDVVYRAESE